MRYTALSIEVERSLGSQRGQADGMLSQPHELWIWTGAGKDLSIAHRHDAPTFALTRLSDDRRATASGAGIHDRIDDLVREADSDLLAHPIMGADWDGRNRRRLMTAESEMEAPDDAGAARQWLG